MTLKYPHPNATHVKTRRSALPILGASVLLAAVACTSKTNTASSAPTTPAATDSPTADASATPGAPATPTLLLKESTSIDPVGRSVTLPLFEGRTAAGKVVWYVVTDSSDQTDATTRQVNFAPKLALALGTKAVEKATKGADGLVHFPGTVDFSPTRAVTPGPDGFPPTSVTPGAVGDADYSPLITTDGKIVLNATQVANDSGQHDGIVSIDKAGKKVVLKLLAGFTEGHKVLYLRLDASSPVVAALEASNLAKNLDAAPGLGSNDPATSSRSAILPVVNGARGKDNPNRQGLQSAVLGEGEPLNIQQSLPGEPEYSPVWDVTPLVWTNAAIAAGRRVLLTSATAIIAAAKAGDLVSGGAGPANTSIAGLKAAGFISNCPTVAVY